MSIANENTSLQQIEILSTFFTYTIMDQFNTLITTKPTNHLVLNMDQFISFIKSKKNVNSSFETTEFIKREILNLKNESLCSIKKTEKSISEEGGTITFIDGIGNQYLETVLTKSIKLRPYEDYDIAFLVDTSITSVKVEKYILAFVIVQRRGCIKYENAYCLNLICSKDRSNGGSILVGLYLYTILCHPIKTSLKSREEIKYPSNLSMDYFGTEILHKGLLEVSGGFTNTSALCLYSKFGFIPNTFLSGSNSNCFYSEDNIAMEISFNPEHIDGNKQKIINIVNKVDPGFVKPKICLFTDVRIRKVLGILYNLKSNRERQLYKESHLIVGNQETIMDLTERLEMIRTDIEKIEALNNDVNFENIPFIKEIAKKVYKYVKYQQTDKTKGGLNKHKMNKKRTKRIKRTKKTNTNKRHAMKKYNEYK